MRGRVAKAAAQSTLTFELGCPDSKGGLISGGAIKNPKNGRRVLRSKISHPEEYRQSKSSTDIRNFA